MCEWFASDALGHLSEQAIQSVNGGRGPASMLEAIPADRVQVRFQATESLSEAETAHNVAILSADEVERYAEAP